MSNRYSSVDRVKENKYRNQNYSLHIGGSLILGSNDFDINQILSQITNPSIKSTNYTKSYPKKLPYLTKKIKNPLFSNIYTKYSDLSTTVNNIFSPERDNNEKSYNYLKTESNNGDSKLKNFYNIIINSNISDRTTINNTQSSSKTNFLKPIVMKEKIHPTFHRIMPNNRLYQKNSSNNNYSNSLKMLVKQIKNNNNNNNKSKDKKLDFYKKIKISQNKIAFDRKYENEVLDASKVINNYKFRENELKVPDDEPKEFISKNKNISINNMLIKLMHNENKKLKDYNEYRSKTIKQCEENIQKDMDNFENYSYRQRELYFKMSDLFYEIKDKNGDIIKLLYYYKTRAKTLEDEIFKKIEQIESIRMYAKFIHNVLGVDEKMFDEELIPNYENDNRPDINILLSKIYDKYGYLLKRRKLTSSFNSTYDEIKLSSDSQTKEEIDISLLNDPDLMIRKYKELEDQILRFVEKHKVFNKNEIKEQENNLELIRDMKNKIKELEKEYEFHKHALIDYKKNEFNIKSDTSQEVIYILAKDLCKAINQCFINKNNKIKTTKKNGVDILELNDDMTKCLDIMIKKEIEINNLIEKIEDFKKNDIKIFDEIMNKRKFELKLMNQKKIFETLRNNELNKKQKVEGRINKIVIKLKKYEPSLKFKKKEVKVKVDEEEVIQKENEELLKYQ